MYEPLNDRVAGVDWWIPGLWEVSGGLLVVWLWAAIAVAIWSVLVLWRLRRGRKSGRIGPQEYRWRSSERFSFFGWTATYSVIVVPMLFVVLSYAGLLARNMFIDRLISENTGWNLFMLGSLLFWIASFSWLYRRLRSGLPELKRPDFGDDRPRQPVILRNSSTESSS